MFSTLRTTPTRYFSPDGLICELHESFKVEITPTFQKFLPKAGKVGTFLQLALPKSQCVPRPARVTTCPVPCWLQLDVVATQEWGVEHLTFIQPGDRWRYVCPQWGCLDHLGLLIQGFCCTWVLSPGSAWPLMAASTTGSHFYLPIITGTEA